MGAQKGYETEVLHQYEAYRNFTDSAIEIAHLPIAASELLYHNCLFENCGTGLKLIGWNDYDNTVDRCEFLRCGRGIWDMKGGNYYVRNTHFEHSRIADVQCIANTAARSAAARRWARNSSS